jgi:hypothetical protein
VQCHREDLRAQILGQVSERLSYDQLYRGALSDPELRRTREELEAAMTNAREACRVVFELFQDLYRFSLDDYRPLANIDEGKARLLAFLCAAVEEQGGGCREIDAHRFELRLDGQAAPLVCTLNRDLAQADDHLVLMGLDHPSLTRLLEQWRGIPLAGLGAVAAADLERPIALSIWRIEAYGSGSGAAAHLIPIAVDREGRRAPAVEKRYRDLIQSPSAQVVFQPSDRAELIHQYIEPTLQRELTYRGIVSHEKGYSAELIGWIEAS